MIRLQQRRGSSAGPRHAVLAWACRTAPALSTALFLRIALAALMALGAGAVHAQPVSPAEVLLFETDHLARTPVPAVLLYDFRKVSNVEPGYTDTVELDLAKENGQMHASLRFLSGVRKRELPDLDDAHGNPVLLGFLEHDIAEMKRLTGGSTTYFRKRIRMELANAAPPGKQTIQFQGKSHEAQVVRIQPYLDDPLHARFEAYVRKTYTFILSDAVPGGIYQLSTSLGPNSSRTINAAADMTTKAIAATTAGTASGAVADARVAKRPGDAAARTGGAQAGGAGSGTAAANGAGSNGAATNEAATNGVTINGAAANGAAADAVAAGAARSATKSAAAAQPGAQERGRPGLGKPGPGAGVVPSIDETLTLVKVADPKR